MEKNTTPPEQLLQWYITAGADETTGDHPVNHFAAPEKNQPIQETKSVVFYQSAVSEAVETTSLACQASTLEELRQMIENFEDCPLKATATKMVFGAGNPQAKLMIIGEAPGAEEDKQGVPFVGASGHLLDLMLHSIGFSRQDVYITNILPWRPPANRKPSEAETALFAPFIRKHIALIKPQVLLLLGGSAVSTLLNTNIGITKARGHWQKYIDVNLIINAMPSFHPAFLLRTPAQKKFAWRDFLSVKKQLSL